MISYIKFKILIELFFSLLDLWKHSLYEQRFRFFIASFKILSKPFSRLRFRIDLVLIVFEIWSLFEI